jgi:hypothetical protein
MQLIESTKNKPKFLRRHWFYGFWRKL